MILSEVCHQRPGVTSSTLPLLAAAAVLLGGTEAALAQAPETDSIPRYNLDSLVVSVLGTPVRVGDSPYPISVVGRADLREGKTGMYLEEALQALPGVQVQNRFNYAVGERVTIRGFGSRAQFGVRGIHVVVDGIPRRSPTASPRSTTSTSGPSAAWRRCAGRRRRSTATRPAASCASRRRSRPRGPSGRRPR
jgi:outer membrane receptor protein involved in Fe transport